MSTTAEPPKRPRLNLFSWDDLLEKFTRTGNDHELKREIHLEMRRRVRLGWQSESYCPLRMWTQG